MHYADDDYTFEHGGESDGENVSSAGSWFWATATNYIVRVAGEISGLFDSNLYRVKELYNYPGIGRSQMAFPMCFVVSHDEFGNRLSEPVTTHWPACNLEMEFGGFEMACTNNVTLPVHYCHTMALTVRTRDGPRRITVCNCMAKKNATSHRDAEDETQDLEIFSQKDFSDFTDAEVEEMIDVTFGAGREDGGDSLCGPRDPSFLSGWGHLECVHGQALLRILDDASLLHRVTDSSPFLRMASQLALVPEKYPDEDDQVPQNRTVHNLKDMRQFRYSNLSCISLFSFSLVFARHSSCAPWVFLSKKMPPKTQTLSPQCPLGSLLPSLVWLSCFQRHRINVVSSLSFHGGLSMNQYSGRSDQSSVFRITPHAQSVIEIPTM